MLKKINRPIFIVGCPRSGTTLLQQMLDAHPEVTITPETHFMQYFWSKRQDYGNLELDNNYQHLIADIMALAEFSEMGLDRQKFSTTAWENPRTYQSLFQLILEQFAQLKQVEIIGEKTPNHVLYLSTLKEFFPSARFIHIIRDPRAVVNSWKFVPWSSGSVADDAGNWCYHVKAGLNYHKSNATSLFVLRYEQLLRQPELTLKSLCNFLNLKFSLDMLSYHQKQSLVNIEREPWKKGVIKPVNLKPINRWQQELSDQEIIEIEAVAGYQMLLLGYKIHTKPWKLLLPIIFIFIKNNILKKEKLN